MHLIKKARDYIMTRKQLAKELFRYGRFFTLAALFFLCACNVSYLEKFGEFDVSQGNYEEAIKDYDRAIRYNHKDPAAYVGRGSVYLKMGQKEQAISDFTKAIELDPADDELYLIRGNAFSLKGGHNQAIQDFSKAIAINPSNGDAYLSRAESYEATGDNVQAVKDYQGAARLGNAKAQVVLTSRRIAW